jgi:predicted permease
VALPRVLGAVVYDLRHAVRTLFRDRTFTLVTVATLALGIGASAAVFSVVDRILFRGLPYAQAGRLASVGMAAPIAPQEFLLSYDYLDWRAAATPFESMGAWVAGVQDCDLNDANPLRLRCARVDSALLPTLGMRLAAGRNFTAAEERPGAPRTALISYGLWQRRFGRDPAAVGRAIPLDGQPVAIAGVLPRDFELPSLERADVLIPHILDEPEQRSRRAAVLMGVVARLKPGIRPARAAAELDPLFRKALEAVAPAFRKEVTLRVRDLRDRQVQDARTVSRVLLGAVLAVLLIACVNAANLALARGAARRREIAVRVALGGARSRLLGQALAESTVLGIGGGAVGCGLAFLLLRVLLAIAPEGIPRLRDASLDLRVLLFALLLALLCGLIAGMAPAIERPRTDWLGSGRVLGPRHVRFRQWLVAGQIAMSLVLLSSAGLLLRSLWKLESEPLGLRPDHVITADLTLGRAAYPGAPQRLAFFESLEQRLRLLPGVTEVAIADSLPPEGNAMGAVMYGAIEIQGRPRFTAGTGGMVVSRTVTPRYFAALGIPMVKGRGFTEDDRLPGRSVVILSEALARRMFPGENVLGHQMRPSRIGEWRTVVGVAANVKNGGLAADGSPEYYEVRPHSAAAVRPGATAIVRTATPAGAAAEWTRAAIATLDGTLPTDVRTMEQRVDRLAERPRFNALLLGTFAGLGLLLAAIGLYGVISLVVTQRADEIGVRMAMGATPGSIARMVLRQAGAWTGAGAVAGAAGGYFAARLLRQMLFRVSANDPWTLVMAVATLACVAMAAAWIPSRRAAQTDPMRVLRRE